MSALLRLFAFTVFAVLLPAACATRTGTATRSTLEKRAAFDFGCDAAQLSVIKLDEKTMGVLGCGRQATYQEVCENQNDLVLRKCSWVQNSRRTLRGEGAAALPAVPKNATALERRAAFDLLCPVESVSSTKLDARTVGVTGCGQKAVYVERCENANDLLLRTCTYVLNEHTVDDAQ